MVKVTVGHICSNLPEAASGDFAHTEGDKRRSPALMWRPTAAVGVPQGMGPLGTRSYTWTDVMDVGLSHSFPNYYPTNCHYSLINTL